MTSLLDKHVLFPGMGAAGAAIGAILADVVRGSPTSFIMNLISIAIWTALLAGGIAAGLVWALELNMRKPGFPREKLLTALKSGAIAGAISGGVAQFVYSCAELAPGFGQMLFQSGCWGIAGALIGNALSKFIPNMSRKKAVLGGALGGFAGGFSFLVLCNVLPEALGRVIGVGVLGAVLGLCLLMADNLFRSAWLEVTWGPNETTTLSLGEKPVYLGGGDDDVHIAGLPQHAVRVVLAGGAIQCDQIAGKGPAFLKAGSEIRLGTVKVVVRTS